MSDEKRVKKVFIAEDEDLLLRLYRIQLSKGGYEIAAEKDGNKAIATLKDMSAPPDFLLLDLGLPGADGLTVFRKAVERFGPIPTVFCSGSGGDAVDRSFLAEHPYATVLTKPISGTDLINAFNKLLYTVSDH